MSVTRKEVRKVLNSKFSQLNDIIADIHNLLAKMETDFFRVAIFGSAQLQPATKEYKNVYDLAFQLSKLGIDVVTGGGPGLMEAASKGAKDGGVATRSIGLHIKLPFETTANNHLDVTRIHKRFSSRLDEFMRISNSFIVTPGGVGTLLELFYAWQLIKVHHVRLQPILLVGGEDMWPDLLRWLEKWPLKLNLLTQSDMDQLVFCRSVEEVVERVKPQLAEFQDSMAKNRPGSSQL